MEIGTIQEQVHQGDYEISYHAEKERYAEDISLIDIETAILNGEVLEDYPDDPRGESCLILAMPKGALSMSFVATLPGARSESSRCICPNRPNG